MSDISHISAQNIYCGYSLEPPRWGGSNKYPQSMFWISMPLKSCPSSFGSIQLMVWEEMSFEEFQDGHHGGHLGYQNRTNLAILNLYVAPMPPIKFRLHLTYGLVRDVLKNFKMADIRTKPFYVECLSCLRFGMSLSLGSIRITVLEMSFEEFQWPPHGGHLGYRNGTILAVLNLYVLTSHQASNLSFSLKNTSNFQLTYHLDIGADVDSRIFQDGHHGWVSAIIRLTIWE